MNNEFHPNWNCPKVIIVYKNIPKQMYARMVVSSKEDMNWNINVLCGYTMHFYSTNILNNLLIYFYYSFSYAFDC